MSPFIKCNDAFKQLFCQNFSKLLIFFRVFCCPLKANAFPSGFKTRQPPAQQQLAPPPLQQQQQQQLAQQQLAPPPLQQQQQLAQQQRQLQGLPPQQQQPRAPPPHQQQQQRKAPLHQQQQQRKAPLHQQQQQRKAPLHQQQQQRKAPLHQQQQLAQPQQRKAPPPHQKWHWMMITVCKTSPAKLYAVMLQMDVLLSVSLLIQTAICTVSWKPAGEQMISVNCHFFDLKLWAKCFSIACLLEFKNQSFLQNNRDLKWHILRQIFWHYQNLNAEA